MKKYILISLLMTFSPSLFAQTWLWSKQSLQSSDTYGVATDLQGNAYLTGPFGSSTHFGSYTFNSISSSNDSYLLKYDSLGNIVWGAQSVSNSSSSATTVFNASDNYGNEYIVGFFNGTVRFGTFVLTSLNNDAFLVKYNVGGNVVWARQSSADDFHFWALGESVATDKAGNIYITGRFEDTIAFGSQKVVSDFTGSVGSVFLVKYDSAGNTLWARQSNVKTTAQGAWINSVCADDSGNAYITGDFTDEISFGTDTLKCYTYPWYGDMFLVKYNTNGNELWARQSNAPSQLSCAVGNSVVADKTGNVYLTGFFHDTMTLGSRTLISNSIGIYGDVFLSKFDKNGNVLWVEQSVNTSLNNGWAGYSVALDTLNHLFMTAGADEVGNGKIIFEKNIYTYTSSDPDPSLVMELDTSGNVLCSSFVGSGGDDFNTIAVSSSGKYVYWGGDMWTTIVLGKDTVFDLSPGPGGDEPPFIARWWPCTENDTMPVLPNGIECNIFVPNAFSPNKDGWNDILYVRGDCIKTMDLVIHDRWGNKVFESTNINYGWDGTYKNQAENTATFAYYLHASLQDGTVVDKKGNITLVR